MASGHAQVRGISGNGFDSGGINIKPKDQTKTIKKTIKNIQHIAVSPVRVWKSADPKKKPITGELLAFAHDKKGGKVSIVEKDNVRMLINKKKVYTFPLDQLSADDQSYINQLVDSARIAGKLIEPKEEPKAEKGKQGTAKSEVKDKAKEGDKPAAKPARKIEK